MRDAVSNTLGWEMRRTPTQDPITDRRAAVNHEAAAVSPKAIDIHGRPLHGHALVLDPEIAGAGAVCAGGELLAAEESEDAPARNTTAVGAAKRNSSDTWSQEKTMVGKSQ